MAANPTPTILGVNQVVASSYLNTVATQAAQSVNRNSTASGYRRVPLVPSAQFAAGAPGNQVYYVATGESALTCYRFTPGEIIKVPLLYLPQGHLLVKAKAFFLPTSASRGGLAPANLPAIQVSKYTDADSHTALGSKTHVWSDEATYEAGFTLEVTGLTETIDLATYQYQLEFYTEGGTNSVDGMKIVSAAVYCTVDPAYSARDFSHWL